MQNLSFLDNHRLVITGGAGFIGSALIRTIVQKTNTRVVNVDLLTYAGNLDFLLGGGRGSILPL